MKQSTRMLLLAATFAVSAASTPGQPCAGVSQSMPESRKTLYRKMIAARVPGHSDPKTVPLQHFMQSDHWSAVFSQPAGSERGIFFFRLRQGGLVLVDVWGGSAGGDSVETIANWTKTLAPNFPRGLALCFANAVEAGQ